MITWRTELHLTCDQQEFYNPECYDNIMLDQLDAKTKKGMFAIAKKNGWIWDKTKSICYCQSCAIKYNKLFELELN